MASFRRDQPLPANRARKQQQGDEPGDDADDGRRHVHADAEAHQRRAADRGVAERVQEEALLGADSAGCNGSRVDRLWTASTIITLRAVAGTSKASRKNHTPAMRNTHESACQETTSVK